MYSCFFMKNKDFMNSISNFFSKSFKTDSLDRNKVHSIPKSPSDLAIAQYSEIIKNFDIVKNDILISKEERLNIGISTKTLMKVLNLALKGNASYQSIFLEGTEYISRLTDGKIELMGLDKDISKESFFANIYPVICFNSGQQFVLKRARETGQMSRTLIFNEFSKIELINSITQWGIIRALKFIPIEKGPGEYAYLTSRYTKDYYELISESFPTKNVNQKIPKKNQYLR